MPNLQDQVILDDPHAPKEPVIVLAGQGQPFVEPVKLTRDPPTQAQHDWMAQNAQHKRMSHERRQRFHHRGTLTAEGDFIPESGHRPVMDGNGHFAVGIPYPDRRR